MVKISLNVDTNCITDVSLETEENIVSDETKENDEKNINENKYLDSIMNKLDHIENHEDNYLDEFHCSSLLNVLQQIQKESLENALILERLIQKEKQVYSVQEGLETEERENYNNHELECQKYFTYGHLIKVALCLFWVYFLIASILVSYKPSFNYID